VKSLYFATIGLLTLAACTADVTTTPNQGPPPVGPAPDGTLVLDWTIDGNTDPNSCFESSSSAIAIDVMDTGGAPAGSFEQSCTTFSTSITLAPGDYTANATLIDANGNPRTTTVPINPFTIRGADQLNIPIDFPASSFF
jgi:hypothetical protein